MSDVNTVPSLRMTRREFVGRELEFPPDRFDFFWNDDYSEVEIVPLLWWDDASYRQWQGDLLGSLPPVEVDADE